jgi:putative ABC transport system permease protein
VQAKVGDEVVLLGQTHDGSLYSVIGRTVGIVSAGNALVDQAAFLPLGHVQFLTDLDGRATELLVYAEDPDQAPDVASALAADPQFRGLQVEPWSSREPWNGFLAITGVVQAVLFVTIVFVTALGIWNTMMMSVLERTGEIGVMRAMGLTRRGAVLLFVAEAVMIATVGSAAGVALGALGGTYLELYGVELGEQVTQNMDASLPIQTTLYADMSPDVAGQALLLGFCMAVVGTALPALRAASIQPVEAMRARK